MGVLGVAERRADVSGGRFARIDLVRSGADAVSVRRASSDPGESVDVSPDGRRMASSRFDPATGRSSIWITDLSSGNESRFTTDVSNHLAPLWSPDGGLAFASDRHGHFDLY